MKIKLMPCEKKPRRKHVADFKAPVVQMIVNGRGVMDVSRALGVSANLLRKWKTAEALPADQAGIPLSTSRNNVTFLQKPYSHNEFACRLC